MDGLRIRKVVAVNGIRTTTEYAWGDNGLAGTIIRDETATTTVVPHYDNEGEAIGFTVKRVPSRLSSPSTTNTYTYVKNLQGDVLRILDKTGNVVVNYTYDPWGKPTVTSDEDLAALNPCSYRGYDYDEETGYYYLRSRYYLPTIGRFISADSPGSFILNVEKVVSANLFSYCLNNPIRYADSTGYAAANVVGAIVGLIGGAVIGRAIANYFNLKEPWKSLVVSSTSILLTVVGWFAGPAVYAAIRPVVTKAITTGKVYLTKIALWIQKTLGIIRHFALKAAKNVSSFAVKTKHLYGSSGNYAKFNTANMSTLRNWISAALKNGTNFQINSKDSYYVIYNLGKVIGTKGERCIKVVFTIAGKIITAYPVK